MDIRKLEKKDFPLSLSKLLEIPEPPERLYIRGAVPEDDTVLLAVVGSRKYTSYGKDVCQKIISGLTGYDITIVSGLALGIDSIAHRSAIDAGLKTIAIPGSGISEDVIYPREHLFLAREIIERGGAIISEFEPDFKATTWSFPKRNRIMAGLSSAVLIIEAEEKSGTLITARLALDYGRDVFVVPGSIFSDNSKGTNWLIRQGAMPITSSEDLLNELGFETKNKTSDTNMEDMNENERKIFLSLSEPRTRQELKEICEIEMTDLNTALSVLEIKGLIKEINGKIEKE